MIMKMAVAVLALGVPVLFSACVATRLPPDANGVSFPVREDSYRNDGVPATPETLRLVRPGLDKDQVRQLLGAPHFTEGLFFVHDWNYLLKLPQADGWLDCQLQVQFDANNRVRAVYWKSPACAAEVTVPESEIEPAQAGVTGRQGAPSVAADASADAVKAQSGQAVPQAQWSVADLRFPFGRSGISDLSRADRERLYAFAAQIGDRAEQVRKIEIIGRSDRIGSATRKYRRSLARAQAIARVFAASGVDPARIVTVGRGDRDTTMGCANETAGPALRRCLAPDREAEVLVTTVTDAGRRASRR